MSKSADKSATRSALKANLFRGPILKVVPPPASSWWLVGAAPDARDQFMDAAKTRARDAWSSVVPHASSPQGNFQ